MPGMEGGGIWLSRSPAISVCVCVCVCVHVRIYETGGGEWYYFETTDRILRNFVSK
jgi:hypothetical protein